MEKALFGLIFNSINCHVRILYVHILTYYIYQCSNWLMLIPKGWFVLSLGFDERKTNLVSSCVLNTLERAVTKYNHEM